MTTTTMKARVTSFAPQFLIDDLDRSIAYYQKMGFRFGEPWDGFYAIGHLDGLELHLKEAPRNQTERQARRDNEHLDAAAGVDGIEAFYEQCVANGVTVIKPLADTAWGTKDFYVEDPDGYIISFGGRPASDQPAALDGRRARANDMAAQDHTHHAIDYIEFSVTDLAESKRFYEAAFDWQFNDYGPAYAGIQKSGGEAGGLRLEAEVSPGGPLVILYSNDLETTLTKVRQAGGRITKTPFDFPGGRRFHFADPSGNELAVWSDK